MIFDIHGDIWTDVTVKSLQGKRNIIRDHHLDRFNQGGMAGGIFVVWADPPNDLRPKERLAESLRAIGKELYDSRDILRVMLNSSDFYKAVDEKKFAVMMGLEGLSSIGEDIEELYTLYQFGFRHASLTWNEQNDLATGVKGDPSRGLTEKGRQAVKLINDLGILLDLSHANDKTFWEVADLTDKPVIATHSNSRKLCNVPRNLTDDQIKKIGDMKGLIGINAYNEFIDIVPERRTADNLINHLEHIAGLIGIDKVALGFDFFEYLSGDTTDSFTSDTYAGTIGLEDISKGNSFIEKLRKRGFNDEDIEKITYKNFLNLLDRVML